MDVQGTNWTTRRLECGAQGLFRVVSSIVFVQSLKEHTRHCSILAIQSKCTNRSTMLCVDQYWLRVTVHHVKEHTSIKVSGSSIICTHTFTCWVTTSYKNVGWQGWIQTIRCHVFIHYSLMVHSVCVSYACCFRQCVGALLQLHKLSVLGDKLKWILGVMLIHRSLHKEN